MTTENWLTLISVVSSGAIGYLIKYALDKRAQFSSQNAEIKREIYKEYVDIISSALDEFQKQNGLQSKEQVDSLVNNLKNFYKKAVLYVSPRVLNAFSDMLQHSYRQYNDNQNSYRTVVLMMAVFKEMRKDIGLSSRGLGSGGIHLLRPLINDCDETIGRQEFLLYTNSKLYLRNNKARQK